MQPREYQRLRERLDPVPCLEYLHLMDPQDRRCEPVSMTLPEQTAIIHYAARSNLVQMPQLKRWALSVVEALPDPPFWIIEMATTSSQTVDDFFPTLKKHSGVIPLRRALQAVILKHVTRAMPLKDALSNLFKTALIDCESELSPDDEPLIDALVEWDCQEHLDRLPPQLESKFPPLFQGYLTDAADVAIIIDVPNPSRT